MNPILSSLPRVEQPYSAIFPGLDVEKDVQITLNLTETSNPPAKPSESRDPAQPVITSPSVAQFNVSGYVGGPLNSKRSLPLQHANDVPPPSVDPSILAANLGYVDNSKPNNILTPANTTTLIRPSATMEIYRPFTYMLPDDPLNLADYLTQHIQVEYDIDESDLGILGLLATRHRVQLLPESFEVIMSMLDFAAAIICLKMHPLERSVREERGTLNTVENRRCAVCNWAECTDSNTIVFCDGCDVAVHQDCYGVHSIPEGRWLCRKCESGHSGDVRCVMCPHTSGAFKKTARGDWIHLVCALWTPTVRVPDDTSFLEPIRDLELIDHARWTLSCYVCRTKRRGACIQCAARDCYLAFHPTCAQTAGFYMENCGHDFSEMLKQQQYLPVYCHRHSVAHAPKSFPPPSLEYARQALEEEQKQIKEQKVSMFAKPRHPYWITRSNTLILPHIVVTAVQQSLRDRLQLDLSTQVIEFLCRYWTIKKDQNDGVMFNRRMYHALEVAELRLIRAEQSEEQEFTPTELLAIVDKLIKVVTPPAKKTRMQPPPKRAPPKRAASNQPASTEPRAYPKQPAPRHSQPAKRRPPSTRKRMRELDTTVASTRKLRNRNSI